MGWPDLDLPPTGHRNLLGDGYDAVRQRIALPLPPSSRVGLYPIAAGDDALTLGHGTFLHDASASSEPFRCMAWSTSKDAYVAMATQRHVEIYDAQGDPTRCLHWVAPARVLHITWHPSRPLLAVHMLGRVQFLTPLMALDGDGVALPWATAAKQSSCWNEAGTALVIAAGTSARVFSWPNNASIGPYAPPQEDVLCTVDAATCGAITAIGCVGGDTFVLATEVKTRLRPTTTTPAGGFTIRARPMEVPLASVIDASTDIVDLMHITKSAAPSSLLVLPELHADAEKVDTHSATPTLVAQVHCVVWTTASSSTMSSVPLTAFAIPTFMHCHRRHAVLGSHASGAIVLLRVIDDVLELVETMVIPAEDDGDGRVLRGLRLGDDAIDVVDTLKPTRLFFTPTLKTCSIRSRRLPLTSSLRVPRPAAVADGSGLAQLLERLQSHLDARLDRIEASMVALGGRLSSIEARLAAP